MCGYIGAISYKRDYKNIIQNANKNLICRGPDNLSALNINDNLFINLIFNRLSILDLSESANQPMISNHNSILMFNGEIYNHLELRKHLQSKKVKFNTDHSDSEVVLNGLDSEGIKFIEKLRGQFAIFYLNRKNKKIYIARDRLGQKPLYYKLENKEIFFSSNLKSLTFLTQDKSVDLDSITDYLNLGIVRSPNTIFKNIKKVKPAELIEIDFSEENFSINKKIYWNPREFIDNQKFNNEEFFDLFSESVEIRSNADVEIANFLSGGLDSTSIVKSLFDKKNKQINTFSVGFESSKYDESQWSKKVADKFRTNHYQLNIGQNELNEHILDSISSLDEPYADPSILPSYLLSKHISSKYKVAISGDGGDELLGGYSRTSQALLKDENIFSLLSNLYHLYPSFLGTGNFFLKQSKDLGIRYSSFLEDRKLLKLLKIKSDSKNNLNVDIENENIYKSLLLSDYHFFLPEMMMFKIDRTSMANSLEIRSPFVDHKLVEYVLSHSTEYVNLEKPKAILQEYLVGDFGKEFISRKKQGFVFDTKEWVYGNIKEIKNQFQDSQNLFHGPKTIYNLSINKSRINSLRIWKLFVLDTYLNNI